MKNALRQKWASDEVTYGAWLAIPSAYSAELMAGLGFDWVCIDTQHGLIGYSTAVEMLQAISRTETTALVRAPWNEPGIIGKLLDAGAEGIIIPMVNSKEEAEAAVAACRYPPAGRRSYGPVRAALVHGASYFEAANQEVLCIPMVETREAVERLDDILSIPGIDAIYVGPNDLSLSLGLSPAADHDEPTFAEALSRILDCTKRHGVIAGCAGGVTVAARRASQGFQLVEVTRDAASMARMAIQDLKAVRSR